VRFAFWKKKSFSKLGGRNQSLFLSPSDWSFVVPRTRERERGRGRERERERERERMSFCKGRIVMTPETIVIVV
jgi:hypothetical protein